eukprot:6207518-Pleurochrysis_carterae.AAC.1
MKSSSVAAGTCGMASSLGVAVAPTPTVPAFTRTHALTHAHARESSRARITRGRTPAIMSQRVRIPTNARAHTKVRWRSIA